MKYIYTSFITLIFVYSIDAFFVPYHSVANGAGLTEVKSEKVGSMLTPEVDTSIHGLIGSYYNGENFDDFVDSRIDPNIDFIWETESPMEGVTQERFSIRWVGYIKVPKTGLYTFWAGAQDRMRITIGGLIISDNIDPSREPNVWRSGEKYLEKDKIYPIEIKLTKEPFGAIAWLDWESEELGIERGRVPTEAFVAVEPTPEEFSPATEVIMDTIHALVGYYYESHGGNIFDTHVATRLTYDMDYNWHSSSPMPDVMPVDDFAVRWEGYLMPPKTGKYTFINSYSDDGMRLYIDDEVVIDFWGTCCASASGEIELEAGKMYSFKIEFQEIGGGASIQNTSWIVPSSSEEKIDLQYFYSVKMDMTETPTFDPSPSKKYVDSVLVDMKSNTLGAKIYYTIDGSDPDENSPLYESGTRLKLKDNTTVKAIAVHSGMLNSGVASADYRITLPPVSIPIFTPLEGVYGDPIEVEISTLEEGTTIFYTTDGSDPDSTSNVYIGPIEIELGASKKIKAFATKEGRWTPSEVSEITYTMLPARVETPQFSLPTGHYDLGREVELMAPTEGSVIHYAIDDELLNEGSRVYSNPIKIDKTVVIKAYASKEGMRDSDVVTETYEVSNDEIYVEEPKFTLEGGTYNSSKQIGIFSTNRDAIIYFTIDGSDPDENSDIFKSPITVSDSTTLKAMAVVPNLGSSIIVSSTYLIEDDGMFDKSIPILGEIPNPQLSISPNPASYHTRITWRELPYTKEGVYLTITNSRGALIENVNIKGGRNYMELNTIRYSAGVYFIKVRSSKSSVKGKLIIGK